MTTTTGSPRNAPLPLLVLGHGRDLATERGVECPGDLPAPSDPELVERARVAKEALGERVFVLGHHYQRDEVIQFADVTGDSFKLARDAAARPDAEFIVFCGVHFMAESADILTSPSQQVVLPDLAAGCSMADMARLRQVEDAWDAMADGLERGGVDAFVDIAQPAGTGEDWKEIAREAIRQRMERHEHPAEVAQALRQIPRSVAWEGSRRSSASRLPS